MGKKLTGGCICGAIRYETAADPVVMVNCHCRDCQRATGSGYAPFVIVPKAAVKVSGQPRYYKTVGASGGAVERGFCPTCGASRPVHARKGARHHGHLGGQSRRSVALQADARHLHGERAALA